MDAAFFRAAVPEPYQILAVRLRPLSLGHIILLRRFNSNFVVEPAADTNLKADYLIATLGDLLLGILICSQTYEQGLVLIADSRQLQKTLRKWRRRVGKIDLIQKAQLFADYLSESFRWLPKFCADESLRESGSPWPEILKIRLMRDLSQTESEILNKPIGLAIWDFITLLEIENNLRIRTEDEDLLVEREIEKLKVELNGA